MAVNDYEIGFVVEIDERGNKSHESVTESCLESQIKKKLELNRIKIRSNIFDLETESLNEISGSRNLVEETGTIKQAIRLRLTNRTNRSHQGQIRKTYNFSYIINMFLKSNIKIGW